MPGGAEPGGMPDWLWRVTPPEVDPDLVRRVVALAASGKAGPETQRRAALRRLTRDGRASVADVLDDLERAARRAGAQGELRVDPPGLGGDQGGGTPRDKPPVEAAAHRTPSASDVGSDLAELQAHVLVLGQPGYPARLAALWPELGPPLWLFVRGALPAGPAVGVIGSRDPSLDGVDTARELAMLLARHGVVVVSGLARGIDEAAHQGALDAGGRTVAVLGTGLGVDYPRGRGALRAQITQAGALVSELAPGTLPRPVQFLWRNRILAGLCDAVVVVEGRARSGALATARLAAEQGREVWAVPGSLHQPTARAPLDLIRDGARPLTRLDDVLEVLVAPGVGEPAPGPGPGGWGPAGSGEARLGSGAPPADPGTAPHPPGASRQEGHAPPAPGRTSDAAAGRSAAEGGPTRTAHAAGSPPAVPDGPASVVAAALSAVPASADALQARTGLPLPTVLAALAELCACGRARTTPRGWVAGPVR